MNILIEPTKEGIEEASILLHQGKLVAFPTETVYGLGANALNEQAVLSIFVAKGRPLTDPLIVHVLDKAMASDILDLTDFEQHIVNILSICWPGPLTIIAKAKSIIPLLVTAGTGYVGVRCPNHRLAIELIRVSGLPIAAPSANRFSHVSPTKASHVIDDLGGKDIKVLNGDDMYKNETCLHGIESTVVKLDSEHQKLFILRQGAITKTRLEQVLNESKISWSVEVITKVVKMNSHPIGHEPNTRMMIGDERVVGQEAPGQSITHYAPDIPAVIIKTIRYDIQSSDRISEDKEIHVTRSELKTSVIVIDFNKQFSNLKMNVLGYRDLSENGLSHEAARQLFDTLRWAEQITGAKRILLPFVLRINHDSEEGDNIDDDIRFALADRIDRAASGQIKELIIIESE